MKISSFRSIEAKRFDSETVKGVTGRIAVGKADGAANFCMRVFELETDGYTPRHTHDWEHEIFVHSGSGEVFSADGWKTISEGSVVYIPGNEEHQLRNTGSSPLIFVCVIPSGPPEL
ncbi:MAG: cupin domain-containing protein [Desulfobacterales bacterium]|jgi:quercetin dioxygenase-like cupin family protein